MKNLFSRLELLVSIVLVLALIQMTPLIREYFESMKPVTDWLDVKSVYVVDTKVSDAIKIIVERKVKKEFDGLYTVKVIKMDITNQFPVCDNSNDVHYTPKDGSVTVTLDQFLSEECKLKAGLYMIETTWIVKREKHADKSLTVTSNPFRVYE